jgi:hypothetical protein
LPVACQVTAQAACVQVPSSRTMSSGTRIKNAGRPSGSETGSGEPAVTRALGASGGDAALPVPDDEADDEPDGGDDIRAGDGAANDRAADGTAGDD